MVYAWTILSIHHATKNAKRCLTRLCLGILFFAIISCVSHQPTRSLNNDEAALVNIPLLHSWSEHELTTLSSLWIESLPPRSPSPTNNVADNPVAAALGQKIFFDKRFSANGQIACAHCHKPELYFTDGLKVAEGIGITARNTPTIVGISYSHWFFLDGRADSLWSQALGPLENELEHGGNRSQFAHIIYSDPEFRASYEQLFGPMPDLADNKRFSMNAGPVKEEKVHAAWKHMSAEDRKDVTKIYVNIGKVVAAYERLIKPAPSRFDSYVNAALNKDLVGMKASLSDEEVAGLRLFISKAMCTLCHNGPLFSDFEFHNINTVILPSNSYDWGRYKGAQQVLKSEFNCRSEYNDAKDKRCSELQFMVMDKEHTVASFKTPSLRNVSKTAPYMHAGQYQTLAEVINHYNDPPKRKIGQSDLLPIQLDDKELKQLEAFLFALESPVDADPSMLTPPK